MESAPGLVLLMSLQEAPAAREARAMDNLYSNTHACYDGWPACQDVKPYAENCY